MKWKKINELGVEEFQRLASEVMREKDAFENEFNLAWLGHRDPITTGEWQKYFEYDSTGFFLLLKAVLKTYFAKDSDITVHDSQYASLYSVTKMSVLDKVEPGFDPFYLCDSVKALFHEVNGAKFTYDDLMDERRHDRKTFEERLYKNSQRTSRAIVGAIMGKGWKLKKLAEDINLRISDINGELFLMAAIISDRASSFGFE